MSTIGLETILVDERLDATIKAVLRGIDMTLETRQYQCGCSATGTLPLPDDCPEHGLLNKVAELTWHVAALKDCLQTTLYWIGQSAVGVLSPHDVSELLKKMEPYPGKAKPSE